MGLTFDRRDGCSLVITGGQDSGNGSREDLQLFTWPLASPNKYEMRSSAVRSGGRGVEYKKMREGLK